MILQVLLLVFVCYIVLNKIKNLYLSRKWGCKSPPPANFGFLGYRFIGEAKKFESGGRLLERQNGYFRELGHHTMGMRVLVRNVVLTCNGENIKALLATQFNDFSIGHRSAALYPLIGHGIFASDGERWKISREMLRPQFSREQVAHTQALEPHFQNFVKKIRSNNGHVDDLQDYFHRLTLDSSSEFLFGQSTDTLLSNNSKFDISRPFNDAQQTLMRRLNAGDSSFLINPKEFRENVKEIHSSVRYFVDKALNTPTSELEEKSKNGYIFLYELVKKTRDPKTLQDELLSILLAGRNTTAGLLSFLFYELSKNPEVWNKLKEEVYETFGDESDPRIEDITFESMKKSQYLKFCLNETLRLHPSVPRNMRRARKDTTLPKGGGPDGESPIFVPKGTSVLVHTHSCHRQYDIYGKDADEFRPERWENLRPGWSFVPFGGGPRVCLGQQFALTEASYFTIRIIQTFPSIAIIGGVYPPKKVPNATLRLMDDFEVVLR